MVESVIKDRIVQHTEEVTLLKNNLHGFCKVNPCLANLLEFFERVNKHVDLGRHCILKISKSSLQGASSKAFE